MITELWVIKYQNVNVSVNLDKTFFAHISIALKDSSRWQIPIRKIVSETNVENLQNPLEMFDAALPESKRWKLFPITKYNLCKKLKYFQFKIRVVEKCSFKPSCVWIYQFSWIWGKFNLLKKCFSFDGKYKINSSVFLSNLF